MQMTIPLGTEISPAESKTIRIRVPNTKFWVQGEQLPNRLWNAFLTEQETGYKEILRKEINTKSFSLFTNIILKTPFPYSGKRAQDSDTIKKFVKKITKQKHGNKRKPNIVS